jgi:hypothetical protein
VSWPVMNSVNPARNSSSVISPELSASIFAISASIDAALTPCASRCARISAGEMEPLASVSKRWKTLVAFWAEVAIPP